MDPSGPGAGGGPWRSDQPQWSQGRPHQPAASAQAAAAARLPPIGPTPLRRQNKRGLDDHEVTAAVTRDDDCDMMMDESPEVRSFKRLKLDQGGGRHAASSSSSSSSSSGSVPSLNGGAIEHNGPGYNNIGSGLPASDPAAAAFHRHHAQQQMVRAWILFELGWIDLWEKESLPSWLLISILFFSLYDYLARQFINFIAFAQTAGVHAWPWPKPRQR